MLSEFKLIERLRKKIPKYLRGRYSTSDDSAVMNIPPDSLTLWTTDMLVDGVDFNVSKTKPEWAGRKALAVNLSDIAAMGGKPVSCLIGLGIPRFFHARWIERFYSGFIRLAKKYKVQIIGGDISSAKQFFVSVALTGILKKKRPVLRSGARKGDWLVVTGKLGGSILGKHLTFEPRLREADFLCRFSFPNAMIDISDGLVQDLRHLLRESRVSVELNLDDIPVSKDAVRLAKKNTNRALRHALRDGEDFELLFTVSSGAKNRLLKQWKKQFPKTPLTVIGRIISGRERIVWKQGSKKVSNPLGPKDGYEHFA